MPGLRFAITPEQRRAFEADQWMQPHMEALADDWEQSALARVQAPTPSDSLTNPLGTAGPETGIPPTAPPVQDSAGPSPAVVEPEQPAPASSLPSPTAPPPTDFGPVPQTSTQRPLTAPSAVPSPQAAPTVGLVDYARQAAQRAGIDPDLFVRQINQESGFTPGRVSSAGARGIAQIVPRWHPGVNPDNPIEALDYAASWMKQLSDQYGGDIRKALAHYNGGAAAVQALDVGTPYDETKQYISSILNGAPLSGAASQGGLGSGGARRGMDAPVQDKQDVLNKVAPFLGNAYVWGGKGPDQGFDCSGLAGYLTTGQPESTVTLYGKSAAISQDQAQAGDLVFWNMGSSDPHMQHVGVYLGDGRVVQSGGTQSKVNIGNINQAIGSAPEFRRIGGSDTSGGVPVQAAAPPGAPTPDQSPEAIAQPVKQTADETISNPFGEAFRQLGAVKDQVGGGLSDLRSPGTGNPLVDLVPNSVRSAAGNAISAASQAAGDVMGGIAESTGTGLLTGGETERRTADQAVQAELAFQQQRTADDQKAAEIWGRVVDKTATPEEERWLSQYAISSANVLGSSLALTKSANPLIQRTGQMLQAKPPTPPTDDLATRITRAWTNRNVSLDKFQEESAHLAGVDPTKVPASADAMALVRLSADPAAEVRITQELKPAVQTAGNDAGYLSAYLMHANNVDVGKQLGNPNRRFPGGFTAADSQQVLNDLPTELGPQRFAEVQKAATQVGDFVKGVRQRMVDSGLIDQATATQWQQQYPNWVPTRILDYLDEAGQGGATVGKKLSLSDAGVKRYTVDGTARFAEDPLGSLVGLARSVETRARKNEVVNALVELDQMRPAGQQLLQLTKRPPIAGETVVQRINNGTVERYVAPPELAAVINGPAIHNAPGYVRAFTNFQRAVTTVLSPAFALVRNPSLDVPEYITRELSRSGGNPMALPGIVADLAKGYAEAFKGLSQGEFRGATARFMTEGGGDSGMITRTVADRQAAVAALSRSNVFEIKNVADVQRILKDAVQLKPISALAQRTEYGPRTASFIRAERAGASAPRAALAGRTVTLDFSEGGTLAKTISQVVPFFNVGFQGTAQIPRMIRENPAGFASSVALTVGLPAVTAQAWNRADAQRSADYDDVSQYLKDQGIVIMLPGDVPMDAKGNRKPPMLWVNMRGFAPLSTLARDATERALQVGGNTAARPAAATDLLGQMLWAVSPVRASSVGDVPGAIGSVNYLPGATTALQLGLNKDIFRQSDIVSKHADESAPQLAKEIAGALTTVAQLNNPNAEIHPSQVNFAVRDLLGGLGSTAMGAREMLPGAQRVDVTPQGAPVVGGALRALGVRNDTGETLRDAVAQPVSPNIERVLRDAGISQPTIPTSISIRSQLTGSNSPPIELRQAERAEYQRLFSQRLSERLSPIINDPSWKQRPIESRNRLLDAQVKAAREYAETQVYSKMAPADRQARMVAGREAQRVKPKP